jgi:endonuclease III related protein
MPQILVLQHRTRRASGANTQVIARDHANTASAKADAPPIEEYYSKLFSAYGPQHWWPGRSAFEIIVGAILVQNTAWNNAAKAIAQLRGARMLTWEAMNEVPLEELERLIKPSGYYRQKARTLKAFCAFLEKEYGGSLKKMFATHPSGGSEYAGSLKKTFATQQRGGSEHTGSLKKMRATTTIYTPQKRRGGGSVATREYKATTAIYMRQKLLSVHGFGPETVDSVLLYAGNYPVFPVDAYARRMMVRHGWIEEKAKYDDVRAIFEGAFPGDVARLNEMHALIVHTGKHFCRKQKPLCGECPLGGFLEEDR